MTKENWKEARNRRLDAEPPEDWLVHPSTVLTSHDHLTDAQMALLRRILAKRSPELLPRLDTLGVVVQKPSERETLRDVLLDELMESGIDAGEPNEYGKLVDDIIMDLGSI